MRFHVVIPAPAHPVRRRLDRRAPVLVAALPRRLVAALRRVPVGATHPNSLLYAHFREGLVGLVLSLAASPRTLADGVLRRVALPPLDLGGVWLHGDEGGQAVDTYGKHRQVMTKYRS